VLCAQQCFTPSHASRLTSLRLPATFHAGLHVR